jgi:hypothetical protein
MKKESSSQANSGVRNVLGRDKSKPFLGFSDFALDIFLGCDANLHPRFIDM